MDQAEARADRWLLALRETDQHADLIGGAHADPESFEFTRRLIELVAGTDDVFSSAVGLREIAHDVPHTMSARDRFAVRAGGAVSLGLPWATMPVAKKWLRDRVADLVLATKLPTGPGKTRLPRLEETLRRNGERGVRVTLAPTGDAVHGTEGAASEVQRLAGLAGHQLVTHVAVDPERLAPGGNDWTIEDDLARAARALRPVFEAARDHDTTVHLMPSSVRWARVMPGLVHRALADTALDPVRVGVGLLAELPESVQLYDEISRWAEARVADGGGASEVIIGLGAGRGAQVAARERISSIETGHPVPVIEGRLAQMTQLFRLAELALRPGRAATLRPVFATEEPRAISAIIDRAEALGSAHLFSVQLRGGVTPGLSALIEPVVPEVRLLLPVVTPQEFGGALDLLLGVVAEAGDPEREEFGDPESVPERELFRAALLGAADPAPTTHRTQLRAREWDPSERDSALFYRAPDEPAMLDTGGLTAAVLGLTRGSTGEMRLEELGAARPIPAVSRSGFANEPDTDATVPANREWARGLLRKAAVFAEALDAENPTVALTEAELNPEWAVEAARVTGVRWASQSTQVRAVKLRRTALATAAARDRIIVSLAVDTGAPIAELDREVSDIIDAARYAGQLAEGLAAIRGATFSGDGLALVAASAQVNLAAQTAEVLSALAAGSGVIWAVPHRTADSAAALLEEWEVAGLPEGAVRIEQLASPEAIADVAFEREIDRAIVLGDRELARTLMRHRPSLRIEGRLLVPGVTVVAPSADLDAAIADIIASAFCGQTVRRANGVVLIGSTARSRRFRTGLADAVRSLRVGDSARPKDVRPLSFDIGPLPAPPSEAGLRVLTTLEHGEEWLVAPEQLDEAGLLWRPGVRVGVALDSPFWDDAIGLPVIGVAHAHTLNDALRPLRGGGSVAALQANDSSEISEWLDYARAASLAINRPTTAARTERQPGGGWGLANMGLPALTGGPNRLITLGSWALREGTRSDTLHLRGLDPAVQLLIETAQRSLSYEQFDQVRRAALADALTWRTSFGVLRDDIDLGIERNVLRHWAVPTQLRLAEGGAVADFVRVLAAALVTRAPVSVSTGEVLPDELISLLNHLRIEVSLEHDIDWTERLAVSGPADFDGNVVTRVRLIGGDPVRAAEWLGGLDRVALWAEPVTMAGPVELLVLLREQSISARAHRHGLAVPVPGVDDLLSAP